MLVLRACADDRRTEGRPLPSLCWVTTWRKIEIAKALRLVALGKNPRARLDRVGFAD
jgi:hypothetical protein